MRRHGTFFVKFTVYGSCLRVGDRMRDGEGINQRTCGHDPWTRTTIRGLTEGGGGAGGRGGQGEKAGTTVIA